MSGTNQPLTKLLLDQINQDILASDRILTTLNEIKIELLNEHDGTTDTPNHYSELSLEHITHYEKQVENVMLTFMAEYSDLRHLLERILKAKKNKL